MVRNAPGFASRCFVALHWRGRPFDPRRLWQRQELPPGRSRALRMSHLSSNEPPHPHPHLRGYQRRCRSYNHRNMPSFFADAPGILLGLLSLGFTNFIRVGSLKRIAKPVLLYSLHKKERGGAGSDEKDAEDELRELLLSAPSPAFFTLI